MMHKLYNDIVRYQYLVFQLVSNLNFLKLRNQVL